MNLKYWQDPQKISQCVAREVLELSEYNLEIHHIKGTSNGRADALSRRPDYDQGEDDNKGVIVLPDHLFAHTSHLEWIEAEEPMCLFQVEDMEKRHPIYEQEEMTSSHGWTHTASRKSMTLGIKMAGKWSSIT